MRHWLCNHSIRARLTTPTKTPAQHRYDYKAESSITLASGTPFWLLTVVTHSKTSIVYNTTTTNSGLNRPSLLPTLFLFSRKSSQCYYLNSCRRAGDSRPSLLLGIKPLASSTTEGSCWCMQTGPANASGPICYWVLLSTYNYCFDLCG